MHVCRCVFSCMFVYVCACLCMFAYGCACLCMLACVCIVYMHWCVFVYVVCGCVLLRIFDFVGARLNVIVHVCRFVCVCV